MRLRSALAVALLPCAMVACRGVLGIHALTDDGGEDTGVRHRDGGADVTSPSTDTGVDAGVDHLVVDSPAANDAQKDSGHLVDAREEAAHDAHVEAHEDAPHDAGHEASYSFDASCVMSCVSGPNAMNDVMPFVMDFTSDHCGCAVCAMGSDAACEPGCMPPQGAGSGTGGGGGPGCPACLGGLVASGECQIALQQCSQDTTCMPLANCLVGCRTP